MGAKKSFPEEEQKEAAYNKRVVDYQTHIAKTETTTEKPVTALTRVMRLVALIALAVTFVLAGNVLFSSVDRVDYIDNRELFYSGAFICTILYFVLATWAFKRKQA